MHGALLGGGPPHDAANRADGRAGARGGASPAGGGPRRQGATDRDPVGNPDGPARGNEPHEAASDRVMRGTLVTRPACSLVAALLLLSSDGLAQTGALNKDPVEVVTKYLSLDRHGARLEAMSVEVLKPYINWKEEPVWGYVGVITDFEVVDDIAQWHNFDMLEDAISIKFREVRSMYWET